jgi:hypothetical protein
LLNAIYAKIWLLDEAGKQAGIVVRGKLS